MKMTLEVHHLHLSQSDRVVWLLEEMQVPYQLTVYKRDAKTGLAPASLKELTPYGTAPYLKDNSAQPPVELYESGAIIQYILEVYGPTAPGTKMSRHPGDVDYTAYLHWLHYANGSLHPNVSRCMSFLFAGVIDQAMAQVYVRKLKSQLAMINQRLATNKFLAGNDLTAADAASAFSLTTMRGFFPYDLSPYKNILRYLKDISTRSAYQKAVEKGDYGMEPMIQPVTRKFTEFENFRPFIEPAKPF